MPKRLITLIVSAYVFGAIVEASVVGIIVYEAIRELSRFIK